MDLQQCDLVEPDKNHGGYKKLSLDADEINSVEDDDILISQAYDVFITQTTAVNGNNVSSMTLHDQGELPEKSRDPDNTSDDVSLTTIQDKGAPHETSLEDLMTLEELIGPINAMFDGITTEKRDEESDGVYNDCIDNDLSEGSTIATIALMDIFENTWSTIQSIPHQTATEAISEIFKRAWKIIKPRSRWRIPDPSSWEKNIARKRRIDGLPYVTAKKIRHAKVPKHVDCSNCKHKCTAVFNDEMRERYCRKYWVQSYVERKNFILRLIDVKPIKSTYLVRKRNTQRSNTKHYFFEIANSKRQVCQNFFCKTLCISPSVITLAVQKKDRTGFFSENNDPRGRGEPPNKTTPEQLQDIRSHIESFPTMESHYVRKDIDRKYLDCKLSISQLYKLYTENCEKENKIPVSEGTYRNIFCTQYNLGFFVPKKDQCLICTRYHRESVEGKAAMQQEFQDHIDRKESCNSEKQRDKERAERDKSFISASFDLQAILQIPSGDVGLLYYVRKLTVYNLTIYESAFPNEAFCLAWTEVNGKKGSCEIGSVILQYLQQIPAHVDEVSLFSDTCGGQNRNQYVAAVLLWAVQTIDHINVIEHKFLESGHSYMEVDSMHSSIETAKKYTSVYSLAEWLNIFRRARSTLKKKNKAKNPYNVKEMKYSDFKDLKHLARSLMLHKAKTDEPGRVKWLKIKRMRYVKDENKIFYNYDMSDTFFAIDLEIQQEQSRVQSSSNPQQQHCYGTRQRSKRQVVNEEPAFDPVPITCPYLPAELEQLYKEPLPISGPKKADLMQLCKKGVIPEEYHAWYGNLKADGDVLDRVPDVTATDESEED